MSHHHHDDSKHHKKQKKLLQLFKNRHTQEINLQGEQHARERVLEQEREEELKDGLARSSRNAKKAKDNKPGNVVWSAKLQMVRDKNTGRQQMAKERWNRFAGTAEAGGRGL